MEGSIFEADDIIKPPRRPHSILQWLFEETRDERFVDNILVDKREKLNLAEVPAARAAVHFRIHNPRWLHASLLWLRGLTEANINTFDYGTDGTYGYRLNPEYELYHRSAEVHQDFPQLEATCRFPLFNQLRASGLTDFVAWPLKHTQDRRHAMGFATGTRGDFTPAHVSSFRSLIPPFALVSEIRLKNALARTLVSTYVGS